MADARQQILDTAGDLFFRDGYQAVGVDVIVKRSGVAKMTLYRHFPSKDDLIVAYLEKVNEQFWAWFGEQVRPHDGDPREQIRAVFRGLQKMVTSPQCYGCPFLMAAGEFPEPEHRARQVAQAHKRAVRDRLYALAAAAGARAPDALAAGLLLLMDGTFAHARLFGAADNPGAHVVAAAEALLREC